MVGEAFQISLKYALPTLPSCLEDRRGLQITGGPRFSTRGQIWMCLCHSWQCPKLGKGTCFLKKLLCDPVYVYSYVYSLPVLVHLVSNPASKILREFRF
jgi:hypothetical protein